MVNDIALHRGGPHARPRAAAAGLPPVGVHPEPAAGLHQGRLRRPVPGPPVEPGVRGVERRGPALRARSPTRSTGRCASWRACGIDTETHAAAARGRLLHQPRGADPRLRGGAHPPGLAHRRLVRLLGPHALDRRAHPPARRRPRRVPVRASATRSAARSARPPPPTRSLGAVRGAQPRAHPRPAHPHHPHGRRQDRATACRRCCAAVRDAGHPVVWACDPMHGNTFTAAERPQDPPLRRRPARDRRLLRRPPRPRAPGPAACTSSSPATTSPSAWAAPRRSSTPTSTTATRRCATPGSTAASRSTWPSGSPSCSSSAEPRRRARDAGTGASTPPEIVDRLRVGYSTIPDRECRLSGSTGRFRPQSSGFDRPPGPECAAMADLAIDAGIAADIAKFERAARPLPRRRPRRGRLPRLPPEQRHLRPAPGRPQPDGAHQGARTASITPEQLDMHGRHRRRPTRRGWGHLTTRQNMQFHFVRARAGARRHARPGVGRPHHPRGLRRHRPQRAGLPPRRRLPLRGARHHARGPRPRSSTSCATRSPSACPASSRSTSPAATPTAARRCSTTSASIAATRTLDDGTVEAGFRVFIAGGLGANPHPALALEEFTAREDLLPTIEAVLRVFDQAGNRDNKLRARLKWLVDTLGFDELQRRVLKVRHLLLGLVHVARRHPRRGREGAATRPPGVGRRRRAHRRSGQGTPGRAAPHRRRTSAGTTPTSCAASPRAPSRPIAYARLGDITADQFRALASIQRELGAEVRITNRQNLVFRGLTEAQLPDALRAPRRHRHGRARRRAGPRRRRLPRRRHLQPRRHPEPRPGRRHRRPRSRRRAWPRSAACASTSPAAPTRCGQHHIADIGFFGAERRAHGQSAPGYQMLLGGYVGAGADPLRREGAAPPGQERPRGRRAGRAPLRRRAQRRRDVPRLDRPRRRRQGHRRRRCKELDEFPTPDEDPDFYVDYGETGPYVAEIGESECAT